LNDITPNGFVLTGKCNMCGMCCIEAWRFNARAQCTYKDGKTISMEVLNYKQEPVDAKFELSNEFEDGREPICSGYLDNKCINHGPNKQLMCSEFPHLPEQDIIFESCGYRLKHVMDRNWR